MNALLRHFVQDTSGATAIEYGLIAAGISLTIVTVVGTVGNDISAVFNAAASGLK